MKQNETNEGIDAMTHFRCPVCAKHTTIVSFPPNVKSIPEAIEYVGLGRGRGFRVVEGGEVNEDLKRVIGERCALVAEKCGVVIRDEERVAGMKKMLQEEEKRRIKAENEFEEAFETIKDLKLQNGGLRRRIGSLKGRIEDLERELEFWKDVENEITKEDIEKIMRATGMNPDSDSFLNLSIKEKIELVKEEIYELREIAEG